MAQNVADQIGVALENARLFEQTVRRADRERKVLEITGKIRSSTIRRSYCKPQLPSFRRRSIPAKPRSYFNLNPTYLQE